MKQKPIQRPNQVMSKFRYTGKFPYMGKHRLFPGPVLPHRSKLVRTQAVLNIWKFATFHNMEIFCGKSYLFRNNAQNMSQEKYHTIGT